MVNNIKALRREVGKEVLPKGITRGSAQEQIMASEMKNEPTYNLKAVVKETGIKPDTLRAWERRYGLPQPDRTEGGHRIFTKRDIETLKWLSARQEEGLSISRAVDLWNKLETEGEDPLVSMAYESSTGSEPLVVLSGKAIDEAREEWVNACMSFDEDRAEQILNQAFAQYSPETVVLELLVKGLSFIGDGWYRGDITVQQEHFASSLATRRLDALIAAAPKPSQKEAVLIACPPEDEHTFSPLVLTYLIRRRGRRAIFLGANVPLNHFKDALDQTKPALVIMTAQDLHTAAQLIPFADLLAERGVLFAFGGLVFNLRPNLHKRVRGHLLGTSLGETPDAVERLLASSPKAPHVEAIPVEYAKAIAEIKANENEIIAALSHAFGGTNMDNYHMTLANLHLTRDVLASLKLGELDYLSTDIMWAQGLIENYNIPPEALIDYLNTYGEVIRKQLGAAGEPVTEAMHSLTEDLRNG
jgi:DNA-binding transcriptional MerR regulator